MEYNKSSCKSFRFLTFILIYEATTTREMVYDCIFIFARYVHNFGLIFRNSCAQIIEFLFSSLVLYAITLDLGIILSVTMTKFN